MAHELTPKANQPYLTPKEVVGRLRRAFKYVDASASRGAKSIDQSIEYMLSAQKTGAPFTDEEIERLRSVRRKSIDIIIADASEPDVVLSVLVEPDERLFFGYESGEHEDVARPLLERIAKVLDYKIELV
jgi:hypothetical protein